MPPPARKSLDTEFVRAQFPPLADGWVFVENAGGTYVPRQVIERVVEYMSQSQVQPNWEFPSSLLATERIARGKRLLAEFINAGPDEIMLGPSTTMNIYLMAQALRPLFKPGDEIIVTEQDHEANVGAWRRLEEFGLVIREWQVDPLTGVLRYEQLGELLGPRTRLVAFTHCSNLASIVHDVPALVRQIHDSGAWTFVDGTAFAPHFPMDVKALGIDFYVFSLYKVFGPHQSVLFGRRELLRMARNQNHFFIADDDIGYKLLPGGPNHEFAAASLGIGDYFEALDRHHSSDRHNDFHARVRGVYALFGRHEARLAERLVEHLQSVPGLRFVGRRPSSDGRLAPVIAFWIEGRKSAEIVAGLRRHRIAIGHGDFWAARLVKALGLRAEDGVVRIGLAHYNDDAEIDRLIAALRAIL